MILFLWHAGFMMAGLLSFLAALLIAATQRRRRWWLRFHRGFGLLGTILVLSGMTAAIIAVRYAAKGHLRTPHTWIGVLTIAAAILTPILGFLSFKIPAQGERLRAIHRFSGRLLTGAALVTVLTGLHAAGVL